MIISSLPIYNATNYAPLRPLLELRERTPDAPSPIADQLRSLYLDLKAREEAVIFAAAETAYTISSFIQGKQFWQQNWARGGAWTLVPDTRLRNPNNVTSINITQFQISQMLEDLISSNPDFEPADMFSSFKHADEVRAAKAVWNNYERKFYTPLFNINQGLQLITTGTGIEEVVYNADRRAFQVFKEIWGEAEIEIDPGRAQCYECGTTAGPDDFHSWESPNAQSESEERAAAGQQTAFGALAQCPNCGSFETSVAPRQSERVPTMQGYEKYDIGDFQLNDIPLQATRFDVSKTPEESPYFIDFQYVPLGKLKRVIGDIEIEGAMEEDLGLDYLYKISRIGAGIGGAKRELGMDRRSVERNAMLCRMSIDADLCAEIDIPHNGDDRETLAGEISGRTLADLCPEGATILGFNGMRTIYGVFPKHHSKRISSCRYFAKPQSGMGRGAEDLMEIQKRQNKLDAQNVKAVDGASPGYAFVEGAVDEKDLKMMGFPNAKLPVRREFFNMTKDVNKFVKQFEPQAVAPQLFEYANQLEKFAQMTAHNVSMSGTVFNADVKTATGQNILEATAQAITIPFLQSKAGGRILTVKNLLTQYREIFYGVEREFSLGSNQSKQVDMAAISGADINPDIEFVVVANSFIPQNYYVRKVDYMNFTAALGGVPVILQLIEMNPRLLNVYEKAFNVDLGLNNFTQMERVCRQRLEQAFELLELYTDLITRSMSQANAQMPQNSLTDASGADTMSEGVPPDAQLQIIDEILSQIHPAIVPKEKNHKGKSDWFADYLDTEDALKMRDDQRRIVVELSIRHDLMQQILAAGLMAMGEGVMQMAMLPNQAIQQKLTLLAQEADLQQQQEYAPPETAAKSKKKTSGG